ncbi:MAG: hypothetical protein IPM56_12910 [Ignavibacteriales bacterium]|nr:MAG: hypothetical protein IPM56_12910 [Ignavibacteriales bacterium]
MSRYLIILFHLVLSLWLLVDFLMTPQGSEEEFISFIPMLTSFSIVVGVWQKRKWTYIPAVLNVLGGAVFLILVMTRYIVLNEYLIAKYSAAYFVFLVLEVSTAVFAYRSYPVKDTYAVFESEEA